MKTITIAISTIFIIFLLAASIYFGILENNNPSEKNYIKEDNQTIKENYNNNTETDNQDKKNENIEKFVFIEEGTFSTCKYCVEVASILNDILKSTNYPIYYISMIKENEIAEKRIEDDYNIAAYPTVFIDGGYKVVYGAKEKSVYEQKILESYNRKKSNILTNLTAEIDTDTNEININCKITNYENQTYNGYLKIYLTEIISTKWQDYNGNAYHYGFIDFITQEEIKIDSNSSINLNDTIKNNDLDPENLKLFAVVFNKNPMSKFSNPKEFGGENNNIFNAYFVDSLDATNIIEDGNTPPAIGINNPQQGKIHVFNKVIGKTQFRNTFVFGKTTIKVIAEDDQEISKVDFFIDDKLITSDSTSPYEYTINKIGVFRNIIRKHTITVKAYDNTGKTNEDSMQIYAFFL